MEVEITAAITIPEIITMLVLVIIRMVEVMFLLQGDRTEVIETKSVFEQVTLLTPKNKLTFHHQPVLELFPLKLMHFLMIVLLPGLMKLLRSLVITLTANPLLRRVGLRVSRRRRRLLLRLSLYLVKKIPLRL